MEQPFMQFLTMFEDTEMTKEVCVTLKSKQKNTIYTFDEALCNKCQQLMTPHGIQLQSMFSVHYEIFNMLHNGVYTSDDDFYITLSYQNRAYVFYLDVNEDIQRGSIKLTEIQFEHNETYYLNADFYDSPYAYLAPIIKNMAEVLKIFLHTTFSIDDIYFHLN